MPRTDELRERGELTHIDAAGAARMVDVGDKQVTRRRAEASAFVEMQPATLDMIEAGDAPKGDVFAVARIAGIMGAKRTPDLIPLCHPLSITHATVDLATERGQRTGVLITAAVETDGKTGVEMEALTAASTAALALYDMCKAVDRGMTITDLGVLRKEGGASGTWVRGKESK